MIREENQKKIYVCIESDRDKWTNNKHEKMTSQYASMCGVVVWPCICATASRHRDQTRQNRPIHFELQRSWRAVDVKWRRKNTHTNHLAHCLTHVQIEYVMSLVYRTLLGIVVSSSIVRYTFFSLHSECESECEYECKVPGKFKHCYFIQ